MIGTTQKSAEMGSRLASAGPKSTMMSSGLASIAPESQVGEVLDNVVDADFDQRSGGRCASLSRFLLFQ